MRGDGFIYQRHAATCPKIPERECSCVFWIGFRWRGQLIREPAADKDDPPVRDARAGRRRLRDRIGAIRGGKYRGPDEEKVTIGELLDALEIHLKNRGAKSSSNASQIRTARERFGLERAVGFTAAAIERYQSAELAAVDPNAPATINRIVGIVRQAFHLARKQERISRVPHFPMLREDNVRTGFVEPETFEKVVAALPEDLADAARFAYATGWRKGQVSKLKWEHVDRSNQLLAVPGALTKNGRPQTIPLVDELRDLVERRWNRRQVHRRDRPVFVSPFVFHRGDGKPLGDIRKSWDKACETAGRAGLLFHDLRRSGVRNMIRAGVDRDVAKKISGHRTDAMFARYNVVDESDQREAFQRLSLYVTARKERKA